MSAVATDLQHAVEDAAAHLYVWALKDIPPGPARRSGGGAEA